MNNKIINSFSDPNTGISSVTIQNKYGKFTGKAFYNSEDDIEFFSRFAGERYAEYRAYIKYAKYRFKQEKIKLQTIQNLIKDLKYINADKKPENKEIMRKINLKLRDYSQSVSDWENLYTFFEEGVKTTVEQREKIINRTK